jgi:hypothetical protein
MEIFFRTTKKFRISMISYLEKAMVSNPVVADDLDSDDMDLQREAWTKTGRSRIANQIILIVNETPLYGFKEALAKKLCGLTTSLCMTAAGADRTYSYYLVSGLNFANQFKKDFGLTRGKRDQRTP